MNLDNLLFSHNISELTPEFISLRKEIYQYVDSNVKVASKEAWNSASKVLVPIGGIVGSLATYTVNKVVTNQPQQSINNWTA